MLLNRARLLDFASQRLYANGARRSRTIAFSLVRLETVPSKKCCLSWKRTQRGVRNTFATPFLGTVSGWKGRLFVRSVERTTMVPA